MHTCSKLKSPPFREGLFSGVLWGHILALNNTDLFHWEGGSAMASLHFCERKRDQMLFAWVFNGVHESTP